jgi:hypothetical protein
MKLPILSFLGCSIQVLCHSSWDVLSRYSVFLLGMFYPGILSSFLGCSIQVFCLSSWDVLSRYSVFLLGMFYPGTLSFFFRRSFQVFYLYSWDVLSKYSAFLILLWKIKRIAYNIITYVKNKWSTTEVNEIKKNRKFADFLIVSCSWLIGIRISIKTGSVML